MIEKISYGTYLLFGLLTTIGAAFIWFYVPETKRLSLEEMVGCNPTPRGCNDSNRSPQDIIFGSEGHAQADNERMAEINREIGLTQMLTGMHGGNSEPVVPEKKGNIDEKTEHI